MRHVQDHQTKNNSCDQGKQQNMMPVSLSGSGQSMNDQHSLTVVAISLVWHYGADATTTTLQIMEPCFHLSCWAPDLPCPWPRSLTSSDHCQSLPRGGTGLLGGTTFPHFHYHTCFCSFRNSGLPFIFLTVLLPFILVSRE